MPSMLNNLDMRFSQGPLTQETPSSPTDVRPSQQSCKAGEESSHNNGQTVDMVKIGRWPRGYPILIWDTRERGQRSSRLSGLGSCRSGSVDTLGVLSATRVFRPAIRLACRIAIAVLDALVVLLSAHKVGDCLRVFRCVRSQIVAANAGVSERFIVASVILGLPRGPWKLQTDERTSGGLRLAPILSR